MDIDLHGALKVSMALGALGTALFAAERAATITTFSVPGAVGTFANCINQAGTSAGYWVDSSNFYHGFRRTSGGTITSFDAPGAALTSGLGTLIYGINAAGTVTGHYADSANIYHGFILTSGGTFTAITSSDVSE